MHKAHVHLNLSNHYCTTDGWLFSLDGWQVCVSAVEVQFLPSQVHKLNRKSFKNDRYFPSNKTKRTAKTRKKKKIENKKEKKENNWPFRKRCVL